MQKGDRMHLVWVLELPKKPGFVQKDLNIPPEASLAISIRNPGHGGTPRTASLGEEEAADYPESLQKEFCGRKLATKNPDLMDYERTQLVFIGASKHPEAAFDLDLQPEDETESSAEIVKELRFVKSRHPIEPLLKGEWR